MYIFFSFFSMLIMIVRTGQDSIEASKEFAGFRINQWRDQVQKYPVNPNIPEFVQLSLRLDELNKKKKQVNRLTKNELAVYWYCC
jgi:hypothetical protein